MKQLVEFLAEGNESIKVEIENPEIEEGEVEVSRGGAMVKASKSFQNALETVKPISEVLIEKFSSLSKPPGEIEVEFGIKMNAEFGVFVASSNLEANFKIKLKWKQG